MSVASNSHDEGPSVQLALAPAVQASTDGTAEVAQAALDPLNGFVIRQPNRDKGAATRAAVAYIDGDIIVIQDADMEYDPAEVPRLIEPIGRGGASVVYGSRLSGGQPQRAHMFRHAVGNRFLSLVTNVLFNTTLSDMETGYKAFRTDVFRSLRLRHDDFRIEPEITSQGCLRKLRIFEVPIAYYGRTHDEGKKITWRDGYRALGVPVIARLQGSSPDIRNP
jgi:glycosyltransferase involved in cell wall biosynthesis